MLIFIEFLNQLQKYKVRMYYYEIQNDKMTNQKLINFQKTLSFMFQISDLDQTNDSIQQFVQNPMFAQIARSIYEINMQIRETDNSELKMELQSQREKLMQSINKMDQQELRKELQIELQIKLQIEIQKRKQQWRQQFQIKQQHLQQSLKQKQQETSRIESQQSLRNPKSQHEEYRVREEEEEEEEESAQVINIILDCISQEHIRIKKKSRHSLAPKQKPC